MSVKSNSAVRFKCNQSGNVFEYFTEHDIKTMRSHSEYTELVEQNQQQKEVLEVPVLKKAGRPPKNIKEE